MKKIILTAVIIIVVIIGVCLIVSFFTRSKEQAIEGKYTNVELGTGGMLEFSGKSVTATYMSSGTVVYRVSGTYEIEDGSITMSFDNENIHGINVFEGTHSFDTGKDYILLNGIKYIKDE